LHRGTRRYEEQVAKEIWQQIIPIPGFAGEGGDTRGKPGETKPRSQNAHKEWTNKHSRPSVRVLSEHMKGHKYQRSSGAGEPHWWQQWAKAPKGTLVAAVNL